MLLPNKLFSYEESVLPLLPKIMRALDEPKSPKELLLEVCSSSTDTLRFIDALDCLYAMQRIRLIEEGKIVSC